MAQPELPVRNNENDQYDAWEDTKYFEEYAKYTIHCDMLRDKARMDSYYNAIQANAGFIKDKIVLDVGCGSGVLACWCAKAGAKKVYAVEASSIADQARLIVARNGLDDIVTVLKGKLEDITLPVDRVDVLISEWMGSFLVFESMLESVLWARDTYLVDDGLILPDKARMYVAPANMDNYLKKHVHFLNDVKGLDMSPLIPFAQKELSSWTTRGQKVLAEDMIAPTKENIHLIATLDINTITAQDLKRFVANFEFKSDSDRELHAFVSWFDVEFPKDSDNKDKPVVLSTSPHEVMTHWRQDVFFLYGPIALKKGSIIKGVLILQQNDWWKRHYDAEISFNVDGSEHYLKLAS
eukprot:TRINITY_DN140_c0_g1_i1.p1 TRINITY_DN140_c0_g1~~TRINITY_DN140_c0_g1_i1.p1  ORF type:complete len:373 (-),score=65.46 TRINITY_DN140_c0_g1_i1:28-1083(-)